MGNRRGGRGSRHRRNQQNAQAAGYVGNNSTPSAQHQVASRQFVVKLPQGLGAHVNAQGIDYVKGRQFEDWVTSLVSESPETTSVESFEIVAEPVKIRLPPRETGARFRAKYRKDDTPIAALEVVSRIPAPIERDDTTGGSLVDTASSSAAAEETAPTLDPWMSRSKADDWETTSSLKEDLPVTSAISPSVETPGNAAGIVKASAPRSWAQVASIPQQKIVQQNLPLANLGGSNAGSTNASIPVPTESGQADTTNRQAIPEPSESGFTKLAIIPEEVPEPIESTFDWSGPYFRTEEEKRQYELKTKQAQRVQRYLQETNTTQLKLPVELWFGIVTALDPRSRRAFAISCKDANAVVAGGIAEWNVDTGAFHGDEKIVGDEPVNKALARHQVVVARGAFRGQGGYRGHEIRMLQSLTLALSNMRGKIKQLELHTMPLLTCELLDRVVPKLVKLEYLGIYRCPLMNIGDLSELVSIITCGKRVVPVELDFYPAARTEYAKDSLYIIAVPALLYQSLPEARAAKANLCAPGRAFPRWLRQVGCGMTKERLRLIEEGNVSTQIIEWISSMKERTPERFVDPKSNNATMWPCVWCGLNLPGCFFAKAQLKANDPMCWGCKLKDELLYVDNQSNGLADYVAAATDWLHECPDLQTAVKKAQVDLALPLVNDKMYYDIRKEREDEKERRRMIERDMRRTGRSYNWGRPNQWTNNWSTESANDSWGEPADDSLGETADDSW